MIFANLTLAQTSSPSNLPPFDQQKIQSSDFNKNKKFNLTSTPPFSDFQKRIEEKKLELKNRLQKIKEERKKEIAQRIYNQINELNKRLTDHFLKMVEKLEFVLERIKERTDQKEKDGLDVSGERQIINEAQTAIDNFKLKIEEQAQKIYSFSFENETELKGKIGEMRQAFHQDFVNLRNVFFETRNKIHQAAILLGQINKNQP